MNKALYPECSNSEDERVLATGDCACCNPNNEPHRRGCAMNPKDSCAHVKYTDKNGNEQKARRWCPESLDENNEVYAYVQNDVDPKFLEGDIWADFWSLGIWDMQARWWVYRMGFQEILRRKSDNLGSRESRIDAKKILGLI